jgi:hypothetical protein
MLKRSEIRFSFSLILNVQLKYQVYETKFSICTQNKFLTFVLTCKLSVVKWNNGLCRMMDTTFDHKEAIVIE